MPLIIGHGLYEFEVLPRTVAALRGDPPARDGRTRVSFPSVDAATRFLHDLRSGAATTSAQLRTLVSGDLPGATLHLDPDEAVRRAALMLVRGHLVVLRRARHVPRTGPSTTGLLERRELPAPVLRDKLEALRLVAVLDRSWRPVEGIALEITAPDGVAAAKTTGSDGAAELDRLPPGSCRVACDPDGATLATCLEVVAVDHGRPPPAADDPQPLDGRKYALVLRRHRVATGETLASIAEDHGTTWQQLAQFNFGTTNPKELNRALRNQVGCRRRTADGANYIFTDDDDPGQLFIPQPWDHTGLRTDETYTLRLQVPRITPVRRFVFSM